MKESGEVESDHTDQTEPDQTKADQTKAEQTKLEQTKSDHMESSSFLEKHLKKCQDFLESPDGGRRDKFATEQSMGDVRRIALAIKATSDVSRLFDIKILRDEYLGKYCKKNIGTDENEKTLKANSIRKYLKSFIDFLTYIICEKVAISSVSPDDVLNLKLRVCHWRKAYAGEAKEQSLESKSIIYEMLVTPQQVEDYEKSDSAVTAKAILESMNDDNRHLSQGEFVSVRDHLLTLIHFGNASRSGVSANMLMEEYESAKPLPDGRFVIKVKNHKTKKFYGPANVTLPEKHFEWLTCYVKKIRPCLPCQDNNVFLSWLGKAMTSGSISHRIHQLWVKAGIFNDSQPKKKLCVNTIRKSASTHIRENKKGNQQEAADTMAHSTHTANKDYFLRNYGHSSAVGSQVISDVFYSKKQEVPGCQTPRTPKKVWTADEIEKISENFPDLNVSMKDVMSSPVHFNASPKQVYNKIKSLKRGASKSSCQKLNFNKVRGVLTSIPLEIILFSVF